MKFLEAVLILSGTIIGVGMFGIPFSFAVAGFWLGAAELAVLAFVVFLFHLIYARVVMETEAAHRLPGYIKMYLGSRAGMAGYAVSLFGIGGTLLAYLLVGSSFLETVLKPVLPGHSSFFWIVALAILIAVVTSFSLRREALVNGVFTAGLIGFLMVLILFLLPGVDAARLGGISLPNFFLPYGVLLFALSGGVAIPDTVALLGKNRLRAARAIMVGTVLPALLYFFFAYAVVGAGGGRAENAIQGLTGIASPALIYLGSLVGFFAVFTSYLVTSINFRALLMLDLRFPRAAAWIVAACLPLVLYLFGFSHFIAVIGTVGAVSVGIESILLLGAYQAMQKRNGVRPSFFSRAWKYALGAAVAFGALQAALKTFS